LPKISEKGYAAIMGFGYYLPSKPNELHEIAEILLPLVRDILGLDVMQDYFLVNILPSLVSKGTFNLIPIKAQYAELLGCNKKGSPLFGYVITEEVTRGKKDCPYLDTNYSDSSVCTAPDPKSCPSEATNIPFCPFISLEKIPWTYRRMFLSNPSNKLVSTKNVDNLDSFLDDFLGSINDAKRKTC